MDAKTTKPRKRSLLIPANVLVPDMLDVQRYLREHADLGGIVPALCRRARAEFGKQAELSLRVYHDPEIDDHYLLLNVRLPIYPADTRERIDAVWASFVVELCDTSGWIIVATDYRKAACHGI